MRIITATILVALALVGLGFIIGRQVPRCPEDAVLVHDGVAHRLCWTIDSLVITPGGLGLDRG